MNEQQFQLPPDWNVPEADFSSYARAMAEPEPYKLHEDARKKRPLLQALYMLLH